MSHRRGFIGGLHEDTPFQSVPPSPPLTYSLRQLPRFDIPKREVCRGVVTLQL